MTADFFFMMTDFFLNVTLEFAKLLALLHKYKKTKIRQYIKFSSLTNLYFIFLVWFELLS